MTERCILCHVSGRVQGVFFRGTAQQQARRLDVRGFAENLPDGRVRVLACGAPEAVEAFRDWLRRGPEGARVDAVSCEETDESAPPGFQVR